MRRHEGPVRSQIVTTMRRLYGSKLLFVEKSILEQRFPRPVRTSLRRTDRL